MGGAEQTGADGATVCSGEGLHTETHKHTHKQTNKHKTMIEQSEDEDV
jgi:hypothetical protein